MNKDGSVELDVRSCNSYALNGYCHYVNNLFELASNIP